MSPSEVESPMWATARQDVPGTLPAGPVMPARWPALVPGAAAWLARWWLVACWRLTDLLAPCWPPPALLAPALERPDLEVADAEGPEVAAVLEADARDAGPGRPADRAGPAALAAAARAPVPDDGKTPAAPRPRSTARMPARTPASAALPSVPLSPGRHRENRTREYIPPTLPKRIA